MKDFDKLVADIHSGADLRNREATGFYAVHCPICQKMDKKTGGFKFENDSIIYNCFRGSCDATCVYHEGEPLSKKFKNLMKAINVQIPMSLIMVKSSFRRELEESLDDRLYKKHSFKPIDFEEGLLTDMIPEFWCDWLDNRGISLKDFSYIKTGKFSGNLLLPFKLFGKTIGHQIITKNGYIALNKGNSHVFYSPSGTIPDQKVFVVEGALDAKAFPDTIAVLGDKITPEQAYFLRGKDVVFIPDRSGGNKFVKQFKDYGWSLCVPPWKEKDLNAAVVKYGVLATARMIRDNIYQNKLKAETAFRLWTED